MIKAVLFDLNGIFIQSPKLSERFEQDFGIQHEVFMPALMTIMEQTRRPNAGPAYKYWQPVLESWGVYLSEEEFWDYWFRVETVSQGMVDFAKELKEKGIMIVILSNNFKERADYYGNYIWIHEVVDKVYFSWQTGFVKPDLRAWENVLADCDLRPEECLYFDDQEKNITSAERVGIKSFLFTEEEELKKTVKNYI